MKMDEMRNMNKDTNLSGLELEDIRMSALNKHEAARLDGLSALTKEVRKLEADIRDVGASVQRAANEVKVYPVETIERCTARVEQHVQRCAEAAERAKTVYDAALELVGQAKSRMFLSSAVSGLTSAMVMGIIFVWVWAKWH